MAKLFLLPEGPETQPLIVNDNATIIGREPENNFQIEDGNVSKYHALLVRTPDGYRLYDLFSANGTFVNDHRITTATLCTNDHIRFGPASFRFESEIEPAPVPVFAGTVKVRLHPKTPTSTPPPAPRTAPPAPTAVLSASPSPSQPAPVAVVSAAPPAPVKQEPRVSIRIPGSAQPAPSPVVPPQLSPLPPPPIVAPAAPPPPAVEQPPQATITTLGGPKPPSGERGLRLKPAGGGGEMRLNLKK